MQQGEACGAIEYSPVGGEALLLPQRPGRQDLARRLVEAAHQVGLNIRIGKDSGLSQAAHHADRCILTVLRLGTRRNH